MQVRLRHEFSQTNANTESPHSCSITPVRIQPSGMKSKQFQYLYVKYNFPNGQRSHYTEMRASKRNTCLCRPISTTRYRKLALSSLHSFQRATGCFEAADARYKFTATKRIRHSHLRCQRPCCDIVPGRKKSRAYWDRVFTST